MIPKLAAGEIPQRFQSFLKRFYYLRNWPVTYSRAEPNGIQELRFRNGYRLRYSKADPIHVLFFEIFVQDCYFAGGFHKLQPNQVIMDVGANIGMFALHCQYRCPGVRVHCFEPASETRMRLQENISINGLRDRISVYPFGLSSQEQDRKLFAAKYAGSRSLYESPSVQKDKTETVQCISLGQALDLCQAPSIDVMKMDVEGAESDIFEGASAGDLKRIKKVAVEYHDGVKHTRSEPISEFIVAKLKENGFNQVEVLAEPAMAAGLIRASRA